jgi:hypothetical protein
MTVVDDRGRVARRSNLVDALIAIVLLVLIPTAYGAYLLFRTPTPKLVSVNPTKLYQGKNLQVEIKGENLRPFMRVSFNTIQGRTFLIGSTTSAMVDLPDLGPGVYDVELFDYMQLADRLPKALTILPLAPVPTVDLHVVGKFTGLSAALMAEIKTGTKFPAAGDAQAEVLSVEPAIPARLRLRAGDDTVEVPLTGQLELPAILRVRCYTAANVDGSLRCDMSGPQQAVTVMPDAVLTLPGPQGWVSFQITAVRPPVER